MPKKKPYIAFCRLPKTRQELRANQRRNDPLVRPKRRRLPTSRDDLFVRRQKSWKSQGRPRQYRTVRFRWHEYCYSTSDVPDRMLVRDLIRDLESAGLHWERSRDGVVWFGPPLWGQGD